MIFASYFRRPLPRWADEGGATSVEHISEKQKHRQMLMQFLRTGRGIAFGQMFAMTEYPQDVMPLYAQGYSLAEYPDLPWRAEEVHRVSGRRHERRAVVGGCRAALHFSDLTALQNTGWHGLARAFRPAAREQRDSRRGA